MTVLVDTSAFFAILDDDDAFADRAAVTLSALRAQAVSLMTHEYVLLEAVSLVQSRLGMSAVRRFVDDLLPLVDITWVDPVLHHQARETMLSVGRRGVSIVDWTSFAVMRRLGLTTAFTFDADFAAEGFAVIPSSAT